MRGRGSNPPVYSTKYFTGRACIVCVLVLTVGTVIYKLAKLYPVEEWNEKIQNILDKVLFFLFVPLFIYVTVFSFATSYFLNRNKPYGWILKIEKVFDTVTLKARLELGQRALLQYEPSLFGTFIRESLDEDYFIIDNYYIKSFFQYGIIYFVCILLIFSMISFVLWKRKEYFALFLISIVVGLGFLEAQIGEIQYDIFLLMAFSCDIARFCLKNTGYAKRNTDRDHTETLEEVEKVKLCVKKRNYNYLI